MKHLQLESGRRIALHELSNGQHPVVFCHPAPGAGNFDPIPEETVKHDVRLIAVDRAGYGASDPIEDGKWATPVQAADDIALALQTMQIEKASVVGWSAGGRVAIALAARYPQLVSRVVIAATPAPDEFVPWVSAEQREGLQALRGLSAPETHAALQAQLEPMIPTHAADALEWLGYSPADDAVLAVNGVKDRVVAMLEAAFTRRGVGLAADLAGYMIQPFDVELSDVQAETLCLYGAGDPVTNERHGRWWQQHLPNARLEMSPDAGHFVTIASWDRVLSYLTSKR